MIDLNNPTDEHRALRETLRQFVEMEVDPQAMASDRSDTFNLELLRKLGVLGVLGITVSEKCGGAGMDAAAAVIVHEELAASDTGFTLSYFAHSMLFVTTSSRTRAESSAPAISPTSAPGRRSAARA